MISLVLVKSDHSQYSTHKLRLLLRSLIEATQRILQAGRQSPEILVIGLPRRHGGLRPVLLPSRKRR
jgi:hypothetical protein